MSLHRRRGRRLGVRVAVAVALVVALVLLVASRTTEAPGPEATPASQTEGAGRGPGGGSDAPGPTPTSRVHRRHTGPVLVLGDSLSVGADTAGLTKLLKADGWQPTIDAEVGRSTRGGIVEVQRIRSVPKLVIVELGTNPSSAIGTFPAEVDTLVDLLHQRGAERVVWVTPVHHDDDRYDDKNRALEAKALADPTVTVADWRVLADANKQWFRSDGLHYNSAGFTALAHFVSDAADAADPA